MTHPDVSDLSTEDRVKVLADLTDGWAKDPVSFVTESYTQDPEGYPVAVDEPQSMILQTLAEHDRVAVRSSHGVGKTTAAAWATEWWLATRKPSLVVTLAGTWGHLEDKLWPEIKTWGRHWKLRDAFEWQELGIYGRAEPDAWRAEASASDKPENIEGWHSPNLLVIIDEAKGVHDEVWAAINGALTQSSRSGARPKVMVLSTPPLNDAGWYPALFGPKSAGWKLIHISAFDSPRVSRDWIQEMEAGFGKDSAVYESKVLGDIPKGGANNVIDLRWLEAAQKRKDDETDRRPAVITCDVARDGEDLTVIGKLHRVKFSILEFRGKNDVMEAAGMCLRHVVAAGAKTLVVDDTGVGGGVTDRLLELRRERVFPADCRIIPVKFGATANRDDRFHSRKDELWWAGREALRHERIAMPTDDEMDRLRLPRSSNLKAQLTFAIYEEDSRSRIRVIDKRDWSEKTKALPAKSPDLAHAFILGADAYLRQQPEEELPHDLQEAHLKRKHEWIKKAVERNIRGQQEALMARRQGRTGLPGLGD